MMMTSARFTKACAVAALTMLSLASQATTLTFEDINLAPGSERLMPAGYGGLAWVNTGVLDVNGYAFNPSGYEAGLVSGTQLGFSNGGAPMSFSAASPFTFNSVYVTAAWNDGLSVVVTGSLNGATLFSQTLSPSATASTLYTFNWSGIDKVSISSSGGTPHYPAGYATHIGFDDLTINEPVTPFTPAVPEPQTYVLMAACLAVVAGVTRRTRQGQTKA
jgi:hypothetical protein